MTTFPGQTRWANGLRLIDKPAAGEGRRAHSKDHRKRDGGQPQRPGSSDCGMHWICPFC